STIFARRKCALHIAVAFTLRQVCLRQRSTCTPERGDDRQADVMCEVFRLIESAFTSSRRVKRHRYRHVRIRQNAGTPCLHQGPERFGKRRSALVLQCVNNRWKRSIVKADAARRVDGAGSPPTARASGERNADLAPRRQRIAAKVAQRWREWKNRVPA